MVIKDGNKKVGAEDTYSLQLVFGHLRQRRNLAEAEAMRVWLENSLVGLGITRYRLGRILGKSPTLVYSWFLPGPHPGSRRPDGAGVRMISCLLLVRYVNPAVFSFLAFGRERESAAARDLVERLDALTCFEIQKLTIGRAAPAAAPAAVDGPAPGVQPAQTGQAPGGVVVTPSANGLPSPRWPGQVDDEDEGLVEAPVRKRTPAMPGGPGMTAGFRRQRGGL
jgi:hypothetical protein